MGHMGCGKEEVPQQRGRCWLAYLYSVKKEAI